jgi:hypothetical protein
MSSYEKTLNEILRTDRIVKQSEEKLETVRGNVVTVWERLTTYKFRKLESNRIPATA